jgi:hypothetical protein
VQAVIVHDREYAGFEPVDAEAENKLVMCAECESVSPAEEMFATVDRTDSIELDDGSDAVVQTVRRYVCSQECPIKMMFDKSADDDNAGGDSA